MKDRISILIKDKGLSANRFAEIIGVQPSGLSHIINGRNKPGYDFITKTLSAFPDISPDWLLLGKGNIYRHYSSTVNIRSNAEWTGASHNGLGTNVDQASCCSGDTKQSTKEEKNPNEEIPYGRNTALNPIKTSCNQRIILLNDEDRTAIVYNIR